MTTLGGKVAVTAGGMEDYSAMSSSDHEEFEIRQEGFGADMAGHHFERSSFLAQQGSGCKCDSTCCKKYLVIITLLLIHYGLNVLFIWGMLEAIDDDAELTLIISFVIFCVAVVIIVSLVIWGMCTNQLESLEKEADERLELQKQKKKEDRSKNNRV